MSWYRFKLIAWHRLWRGVEGSSDGAILVTESEVVGLAKSDIGCSCCEILPLPNDVKGCWMCVDTPTCSGGVLATETLVVEPGKGGWQTDGRVSVVPGWGKC